MEPISFTDQVVRMLVLAGIVIGIFYWICRPARVRSGSVITKLGTLQYRSGNNLVDYHARAFHGVEVVLPKRLPHIYVDGHNTDSPLHGPRYVFKKQSRLSLEGNFDKYFQVYAISRYHRFVLTFLQPDVMATLVDILADYDVEIWQDRLRIISNTKVYNKQIEQDMQKLAVRLVDDMASRIQRIKRSEEEEAGKLQMVAQADTMTKFGKKYISSFAFLSGFMLICLALPMVFLGYFADAGYIENLSGSGHIFYFGAFLLFPCLWGCFVFARRKGWF